MTNVHKETVNAGTDHKTPYSLRENINPESTRLGMLLFLGVLIYLNRFKVGQIWDILTESNKDPEI